MCLPTIDTRIRCFNIKRPAMKMEMILILNYINYETIIQLTAQNSNLSFSYVQKAKVVIHSTY